jgi:regulator of protease activity HflC (stomatin/prohibitin superfamily)
MFGLFGLRFIKTQPAQYLIQFKNGKPQREGNWLSMLYVAPTTTLVVVPTASVNEPFMSEEATADFQEVTIQGQVTYRVSDPKRTAALLNFSLDAKGRYATEDPPKASQRLSDIVRLAMRAELKTMTLQDALASGERLVAAVRAALRAAPMNEARGAEVIGLSMLAIKPKPETARAREAEARRDQEPADQGNADGRRPRAARAAARSSRRR